MSHEYRIYYDTENGMADYTVEPVSLPTAKHLLEAFKQRHLSGNNPKPYPNGKGFYDVSNPRIVRV